MYTFLCGRVFLFVLGIPLEAKLLDHMLILCLIFQGTATLFSAVAQSFGSHFLLYSDCNFAWRLASLCYCSALFMSRFPEPPKADVRCSGCWEGFAGWLGFTDQLLPLLLPEWRAVSLTNDTLFLHLGWCNLASASPLFFSSFLSPPRPGAVGGLFPLVTHLNSSGEWVESV